MVVKLNKITGDEEDNIILGTEDSEQIFGFAGDDLITANAQDTVDGGEGFDTVVLAGDFDPAFITEGIGFFEPNRIEVNSIPEDAIVLPPFPAGLFDVELRNVELLRFDDRDVSVLEFIDDLGDTRDVDPGFVKLKTAKTGVFDPREKLLVAKIVPPMGEFPPERVQGFSKGIINTIDDTDGFVVELEAGTTYDISAALSNFVFGPSGGDLEILGVFDPDDALIAGTDIGEETVSFTATEDGEHFFTVAGIGEAVGVYDVGVRELRVTGNAGDNNLLGTEGADTIVGNGGDDRIDGNGGVDVAVFAGDFEDFDVFTSGGLGVLAGPFDQPTQSVFVENLSNLDLNQVTNVEILRFDDQDVSVLDFIDDFGDTLDEAGKFFVGKGDSDIPSKAFAKGSIDAIGDVDAFTVDLSANETFVVELLATNFLIPAGPEEDGDDAANSVPFTLLSILDPSGEEVAVTEEFIDFGFGSSLDHFFRAEQAGTYLFSVAGVGEEIGSYGLSLSNIPLIGDDENNFLEGTPLDDVIEGNGGDDTISASAGTDTIDGGEGFDRLFAELELSDVQISVAEDETVTLTGPDGVATVTNVESFIANGEDGFVTVTLEELLDFAERGDEEEPFVLQLGDDDDNELTGGLGTDIYDGRDGDDTITDAGGDSDVDAGAGSDKVSLISGTNTVEGGSEGDLIIGGFGNDDLSGGTGDDVIRGDVSTNLFGSDRIAGGEGDDLLEGGGGIDTFVFATNEGTDTIGTLDIDFDTLANSTVSGADFVSGLDQVELAGFGFADQAAAFANVTDVGGVATFSDQGTTIVFEGLTTADLSADDFILV